MTPSPSPHALRVAAVVVFTLYGLVHARCEWNLHKRKKREGRRGFEVVPGRKKR